MKVKHLTKLLPFHVIVVLFFLVVGAAVPFTAAYAEPASGALNVAISTLAEETFLPWNGSTVRKPYLDPMYEYIAYIDPKTSQPEPGLAEKWEYSEDGKSVTLWLRKGVQFHGGWGEFTSEDVKFSIERMLAPSAVGGQASALRMSVVKVEAPEKYKAVVSLKAPDPFFVQGYLGNGVAIPMACKKYVEEKGEAFANAHPIGTGPFTLAEHKKGTSITLKAIEGVENHWRVHPEFRTITFLSVAEEASRVAMLKNGEVDIAPINCSSIQTIDKEGLRIFSIHHNWTPVLRFGGLSAKFSNPSVPWAKKEVRQALNYAVDRTALINDILKGNGDPAGIDPDSPVFENITPYPYDPQKAKKLLADAGYPNGFDAKIYAASTIPGAELPLLAEMVAMQWRKVGIRANVETIDNAALRKAWTTGKYTGVIWTHRTYPVANLVTGFLVMNSTRSPFATFSSSDTDKKIMQIAMERDQNKRTSLTQGFAQYLNDEAASVYLVHASEPYGLSKKVGSWPAINQNVTNFALISRSAK